MPGIVPLGPNDDDHPSGKKTDADDPLLAVVLSVIDAIECQPFEHRTRSGEVETAFRKGSLSLRGIERDPHGIT